MKSEDEICQTFTILHYYTAAEYNIAVIEHNVLSRSYRSYLFIKYDPDRISVLRIYGTRLFSLPVTCLCLAFKLAFGIFKRYPVKIICIQRIGKKKLVTAKRYGIIIGIFSDNIHRFTKSCAYSSPLSYRVKYNALVPAYNVAVFIEKIAVGVGVTRITLDKAGIIAVRHKAYILAVGLVAVDKSAVSRNMPYLVLCHFTERENACGKLLLT